VIWGRDTPIPASISTLPSGAGQDGDVSAGALEYADIVSQLVRNDGRYRGAVLDQADDAARLRKCLARRKPYARCRVESTADAAEAKASSG
jgi:hypothetical protein